MYCKKCGKKIPENSTRCPHCGKKVSPEKETQVVVKQKITQTESARRAVKEVLTIGILESVAFVFNVILLIILCGNFSFTKDEIAALRLVYGYGVEGLGVAALVILIVIWCRWHAIKTHTDVSHKWFTIGYPIALGVEIILGIVFLAVETQAAHIAVFSLMLVIDALFVAGSFTLSTKMRKTLHR